MTESPSVGYRAPLSRGGRLLILTRARPPIHISIQIDAPNPNSGRAGLLSPFAFPKQPQVDGIRQREAEAIQNLSELRDILFR